MSQRFDFRKEGGKWRKEDFATLASKTKESAGINFKYDFSYEELGFLIQKFVPAWRVEIEKYFKLIVFNFLFSNGDAHLKNFSLLETTKGDSILSPAYDLINTKLHVDDSVFALDKGLFADGFMSDEYKKSGYPAQIDFFLFAKKIGIEETRILKLLDLFIKKQPKVETLITNSFLSDENKRTYLLIYQTRRNFLNQ